MEYRYLGRSGLKVPALGFGCGTFGGQGPLFSAWGTSGMEHARRMVDVYSDGASESVLGEALAGRRRSRPRWDCAPRKACGQRAVRAST